MAGEFQRPRTLAVTRAVVYLATAVACLVLFVLTIVFLATMGILGLLSVALFDDANTLVVVAFGGFGLLVSGVVAFTLLEGVRRVDRWLVETARRPDPVEEVTASYVAGDVDEAALERRLERVLGGASPDDTDPVAPVAEELPLRVRVDEGTDASPDREASERR